MQYPKIGQKRVDWITTADVMGVLLPIWNEKHQTAKRLRQRIATVMTPCHDLESTNRYLARILPAIPAFCSDIRGCQIP